MPIIPDKQISFPDRNRYLLYVALQRRKAFSVGHVLHDFEKKTVGIVYQDGAVRGDY
jgi:hypothetical protein